MIRSSHPDHPVTSSSPSRFADLRLECPGMPGVWLDARRAAWFDAERALVLADLHLGYAWAQRRAGLLLPLPGPEAERDRLASLRAEYRPKTVVFLGDIVHRAVELPALAEELTQLVAIFDLTAELRFVAGNHDRNLEIILTKFGLPFRVEPEVQLGQHLLLHGDECAAVKAASPGRGRYVMGHEHPAIRLGDGVTTAIKCPCFMVGPRVLILPAFSRWAAGSVVRQNPFMSSLARTERFDEAIAILGNRLLRIPI